MRKEIRPGGGPAVVIRMTPLPAPDPKRPDVATPVSDFDTLDICDMQVDSVALCRGPNKPAQGRVTSTSTACGFPSSTSGITSPFTRTPSTVTRVARRFSARDKRTSIV